MSKVHVCLVSEQLIPNVLPVLKEKPVHAVLLSTSQMEQECAMLETFFNSRGIKTTTRLIPAFDFKEIIGSCKKVIGDFADTDLVLNVTGGTKVAALAAFQQFYFDSLRIIYVDTSHNRLLELGDDPKSVELEGNLLRVKDYLACYGKCFASGTNGTPPVGENARRGATVQICDLLIKNPELLLGVNRQVAQYKQVGKKPYFGLFPETLAEGGIKLCRLLRGAGIVTEGIEGSVNFNREEDLFYLGGGWLEEYVFGVVADCVVPGLDLCMNVEIEWRSQAKATTRNELDIAFTHRNRLHIISCKTSGLDRRGSDSPKGKEALYELDSLADNIGGLFARSMLVSAHQLGKASRQRADDLGIEVVAGLDVLGLKKQLKNSWLG